MKTSLLRMKKAVVKCTGMDMPELELPMYNNPHRFVHALLESSEDLKTMKLFKAVSMMHKGNQQQSQVAPIQLVLGTQQAPQDNMMKKMFMKMMMRKTRRNLHLEIWEARNTAWMTITLNTNFSK